MFFTDSRARWLDPRRFFVSEREAPARARAAKVHWARWGGAILAVVALYAALGFWGVPALLPRVLAREAAQQGGRQFSAGEIRFNPFTLRLEASDLRLRDRDGSDLLALGGLAAQAQWRSITRRAWSLAELRLVQPSAWLRIAPDGDFNLARLLADFARGAPAQPDASLPRVIIERFGVEGGRIDFDDRHAGYRNVIAPVAFELRDFSSLPQHDQDHVLSARSQRGGVLRWKGTTSLQPLHAAGELTLENVSLPELSVYLQPWTRASVAAGQLDATVPYAFSYAQGKVQARIAGARTRLRQLAFAQQGLRDRFASLDGVELAGIDVDLVQQQVRMAEVRAAGGRLAVRRDARGELDLQAMLAQASGPAAAKPAASVAVPPAWHVELPRIALEHIALNVVDESYTPTVVLDAADASLHLGLVAGQESGRVQARVSGAELELANVTIGAGQRPPLKLARAAVSGGHFDLAARRFGLDKLLLDGVQAEVRRGADGRIEGIPAAVTVPGRAPAAAAGPPWTLAAGELALRRSAVHVVDEGSKLDLHVQDVALTVQGAGNDLARPLQFSGELALRTGGRVAAKGQLVPATGVLAADVQAKDIALAPVQSLLGQYVRLRLAGGAVSASGRVLAHAPAVPGRKAAPAWQYEGAAHVRGLVLKEEDGDLFASWKDLGTERLRATLSPNRLDIPELRLDGAQAKLIIEDDRSLNAARLLVQRPAPAAATSVALDKPAGDAETFPVRIRRVRLRDAKLDFTDLSLRPQFAAKIYELNGAINGLSTERQTRSQVELDGRVDDFGLARVRGELNAFSPRDSTDLQLVFRNVDMVPASPYSMKFAGYRIDEGRISLDLQYRIKDGRLEGDNRIVIDKLKLGERVDSPDAMKIPLQLAIAILKDSEGRIDLGLPVSGSLDDPQFSYGALIWKAITNLLGKVVTAPFRALGAAFGIGGERLEAIDFDPGSARLLPPEREKLQQVAGILAKRAQLKLLVPGPFSEAADGAALRRRALRLEVARRAGVPVPAGEEPGPLDAGDRAVRVALRELFVQRFGKGELEQEMAAAEKGAGTPAPGGSAPATSLRPWQRIGKWVQGEPQVGDAAPFYAALQRRLEEAQELPAGSLQRLGEQRAAAVMEALLGGGLAADRATAATAAAVEGAGKAVPLRLELSAR